MSRQQQQQMPLTKIGYDQVDSEEDIGLQDIQRREQESRSSTFIYNKLDQHESDSSYPVGSPYSHSPSPNANTSSRSKRSFMNGWRRILSISSCTVLVIIIVNIVFLVWALQQPIRDGNRVLFQGDCDESKKIDVWAHLVINIMSTLVLGASNYSMQVLTAPTRALVDAAHANNKFLNIGISSFRNLMAVPHKQKLLWTLLLVGSLPLHLFWNSVIISTDQTTDYQAFLVTQDFVQSLVPNGPSQYHLSANETDQIFRFVNASNFLPYMHTSTPSTDLIFEHVSTADCASIVKPLLVRNAAYIILVSNVTVNLDTQILDGFKYQPTDDATWLYTWQCDELDVFSDDTTCLTSNRDPDNWTFSQFSEPSSVKETAKVEYCLVNIIPDACTVEFLPTLQGIVLACNALKLATFLIILLYMDSQPLLTIGDVIASFLDNPEPSSSLSPVTARSIKASLRGRGSSKPARFYFNSASGWRLGLSFTSIVAFWLLGVSAFALSRTGLGEVLPLSYAWTSGITSIQPGAMFSWTSGPGSQQTGPNLFLRALWVNTFQLVLSILYFSYNAIFTSILMAREWVAYAQSCKGLRTYQSEGEQRPTHFLSLPYRYSVPMMVASGFLHWFLSLGIFVTQIHVANEVDTDINGVGWSSMCLLLLISLGGSMIIVLLIAGFRRYPQTVPMVASNSLAISANCQPVDSGKREAIQKLQYGIVTNGDTRCYTFSSGKVQPLVHDQEPWPRKLWTKCKASMTRK